MTRIGLVINPIAGMGGRVGLKGTDDMADEARQRGARPVANVRAVKMLSRLKQCLTVSGQHVGWLTCSNDMGANALKAAGFEDITIVYQAPEHPSATDTRQAVKAFEADGAELVVFCGGDGTARDICQQVAGRIPLLGIPSGVKMYSGVFGITPELTAELVAGFVEGRLEPVEVDVIDLDEARYRQDEWAVRVYCSALTPYEPSLLPMAKALIDEQGDAEIKDAIADDICERMRAEPDAVYLLGPGTTIRAIAERLGIKKTLMGIDAVRHGKLVARDLNEQDLVSLLSGSEQIRLLLSPIGAQGFLLGRGNLELSPDILRRIGTGNLMIIATPAKLTRTPVLRFDTGDPDLDQALAGYRSVITGYHRKRMVPAGFPQPAAG